MCDGYAGISQSGLDVECILEGVLWTETDWIGDESVFEFFDLEDFRCLCFDWEVGVDDTNSAHERHVDGHFGFCDRVHGGGDEWCFKFNILCEVGGDIYVVQAKVYVAWHHDQVVVGIGHTCFVFDKYFICCESEVLMHFFSDLIIVMRNKLAICMCCIIVAVMVIICLMKKKLR